MSAITGEVVSVYASLFVHCWDYYAVQQRDGSYRPSRCSLSLDLLAGHLMGRYTLGTYVVDAQGYCSFAVFDADDEHGLLRLACLAQELAGLGVMTLLEASRRGGHLWVILDGPTPARAVRAWLLPYAQALSIELYPMQDIPRPGGVGSLIRLPLGVHRQTGGWYPFVVSADDGSFLPVGETVADCCLWAWSAVERVTVPDEYRQVVEVVRPGIGGDMRSPGLMASRRTQGTIREWCQAQDIVQVIGQYTDLDRRGVGSCPLKDHHARGDEHPSFQVFGGNDPHWYCYTWRRAGNLFDFLCLYYGLTVQEMWERLQQGTLVSL